MTAEHIGGHRFPAQAESYRGLNTFDTLNATFPRQPWHNETRNETHSKLAFSSDVHAFHQWKHAYLSPQSFFPSISNDRFFHVIFTRTSRQFLIQTPKILHSSKDHEWGNIRVFSCPEHVLHPS